MRRFTILTLAALLVAGSFGAAGAQAPPIRQAIVVRSPCDEATGSVPVLRSTKHPVP